MREITERGEDWKKINSFVSNFLIKESFCKKQEKINCRNCLFCEINEELFPSIDLWVKTNENEMNFVEGECIDKLIRCACEDCNQYHNHLSDLPLMVSRMKYFNDRF